MMINKLIKAVSIVSIFCSFHVYADELFLCKNDNGDYQLSWNKPAQETSNCEQREVTSHKSDTALLTIIPKDESSRFFVVSGSNKNNIFYPTRVVSNIEANTDYFNYSRYIQNTTSQTNMLLDANIQPFGIEERANVTHSPNGSIILNCNVGNKPAGFLLNSSKLLQLKESNNALHIAGQLDNQMMLSIIEKGTDLSAKQASILSESKYTDLISKDISFNTNRIKKMKEPQLIFACPNKKLSFDIKSLYITNRTPNESKKVLSAWNWDLDTWVNSPKNFIFWAQEKNINRLYIQLPIQDNKIQYQQQLDELLNIASSEGIEIFAVEGDAHMITKSGLENAIARNKTIKQFCSLRDGKPCLSGIQYDIEPYILNEYTQNPAAIWAKWTNAIKSLSESWGSKIEVVVPFWLLNIKNGENIAKSVSAYTSEYTIMAYRTSNNLIYNISAPWLFWAEKNHQKVIVALENGNIDEEEQRTYVPNSSSGELEKVPFDDMDVMILNNKKITGSPNLYSYETRSVTERNFVSFMGQESQMLHSVSLFKNIFSQWDSFNGFALHGLNQDSLR